MPHEERPNYLHRDIWPKDLDQSRFLVFDDSGGSTFHTGRMFDDEPPVRLKCGFCGSVQFEVGQSCLYTAIRCVVCGWECGIHEG